MDATRDSDHALTPESPDARDRWTVLASAPDRIPRLPVFEVGAFAARDDRSVSCLLDQPGAVYTTSGCAAIMLALRALGVGRGDKVLVPTYHCPTMIAPIARLDATPLFFPIDAGGAPELAYLEGAHTRGAKALIAVHYFGMPQSMSALQALCEQRGWAMIEDCAHALFGESDGQPIGSRGAFAIGSLPKFLPVPEGGCLLSRAIAIDADALRPRSIKAEIKGWADMLQLGAQFGRLGLFNRPVSALFETRKLLRRAPAEHGGTETMAQPENPVDAFAHELALSASRATRAVRWVASHADRERIVSSRRRNYALLAKRLAGLPGARALFPSLPDKAVPYVFPLWVDDPEPRYRALRMRGLPLFRWDWRWPGTPDLPGDQGQRWAHHVFQLPCHQALSDADLDWMTATLADVFAAPA